MALIAFPKLTKWADPQGGLRGVRSSILRCYVTKFAPHKALKLIASCKSTFNERSVVHRVDNRHEEIPETQLTTHERGRLDQCLHVAPNRGREGRSRSEIMINTNIASVSCTLRLGSCAPTVGHT